MFSFHKKEAGLNNFNYERPRSLREAVSLRSRNAGAFYLAGGTDLIVQMRDDLLKPSLLIDLKALKQLEGIDMKKDVLHIAALTKVSAVEMDRTLLRTLPFLCDAAGFLGSPLTRNKATIGGNICNASPAAEFGTPLIALNARAVISDGEKTRVMAVEDFMTGVKKNALKRGELLSGFIIPDPKGHKGRFFKKSRIKLVDLATVNITVIKKGTEYRIAIGSCFIKPLRIRTAEEMLRGIKEPDARLLGKAARICAEEIKPIDDLRGTADFRRDIVFHYVKKLLGELTAKGGQR